MFMALCVVPVLWKQKTEYVSTFLKILTTENIFVYFEKEMIPLLRQPVIGWDVGKWL